MDIYKYQNYTIAMEEKKELYIVEEKNSFYHLDKDTFSSMFDKDGLVIEKTIKDNIAYMLIMVTIIIVTMITYFFKAQYVIVDVNFLKASFVLLINIVIHELGHILFLKWFNRDSKFKVGFKLVFIYPAFYVDTSYSYFLPQYKRAAVYMAGNTMNCIFVLGIIIFLPNMLLYCYLIVSNILINFLPIVKSDGYYAFITFFNR